jgi:hypothetical protein
MTAIATAPPETSEVQLDRDVFLRRLLRELAGTLQDIVGLQEASGYISVVGAAMGEHIDAEYRRALAVERLSRAQVAEVLVDLKRRIQGCMMTSNVFGSIAAENLGYAGVELERTIAEGHAGCRVVIHLRPTEHAQRGLREYFRRDHVRA